MGYKMELDLPNAGKGVEVYIDGLGIYKNPGTYEIDDEQAETFRVVHQVVKDETDEDGEVIRDDEGKTNTVVESGPTIEEYFDGHEGVTITVVKSKDEDETKKVEGTKPEGTGQNSGGVSSPPPVVVKDTGPAANPATTSKPSEGGN